MTIRKPGEIKKNLKDNKKLTKIRFNEIKNKRISQVWKDKLSFIGT